MDYKKPQSTLVQGGTGIYPLTTADQVILADGSRLEKDGRISADSAANSAKLGGKAPEYYLQPRNLLDNSDFRNPVNQRGIAYGANRNNGYTIDRWYYEQSAGAGDGYFGLTEYYVSLLAPSDGYSQMYQNLEKYDKLKGKNVTFAARVSHGSTEKIVCVTFTLGSISVGLNLFEDGNLKLYSVDGMNILIRATGAEEFQFIWAALYEGSYTADTLPPYVPKGYAAELAECQRRLIPVRSRFTCVAFSSRKMLCNIFSNIPLVGDRNPGLITTRINADIVGNGIHGMSLILGASHGNVHSIEMETDNEILTQNAAYTVDIPSGVFIEEEL